MTTHNAMTASSIAPGTMKVLVLHGVGVAIANVDGVFYAFSDACPHDGYPLSQGRLDGKSVICLQDGSQFDLSSGIVQHGPATTRVRTYHIQIRGDEISI